MSEGDVRWNGDMRDKVISQDQLKVLCMCVNANGYHFDEHFMT